jgi:hypothetical protein
MYEFPDEKDPPEEPLQDEIVAVESLQEPPTDKKPSPVNQKQKVLRFSDVTEDIDEKLSASQPQSQSKVSNVDFDFLRQNETPRAFGTPENQAGHDGKAVKRKQINNENVTHNCHNGSGDFSSSNITHKEYEESSSMPLKSHVPYSTKVIRGKRGNNKKKSVNKFSFGYGDESELSPIKGASAGGCKIDSPLVGSKSQFSSHPMFPPNSANPTSISLEDLKLVWREIETKRQVLEDQAKTGGVVIEDLGNISSGEEGGKSASDTTSKGDGQCSLA